MMKQNNSFRKKRFQKFGTASYVGGILLLVALVAINVLLACLPSRVMCFDVTGTGLSKPAPESEKLLDSLEEDVTIYWLCENGVVDDTVVGGWLPLLLERYESAGDHVTVTRINTTEETEFLGEYGLTASDFNNYSFLVESARRYTLVDAANLYLYSNAYIDHLVGEEYIMDIEELENLRQYIYYYQGGVDVLQYETYQHARANAEITAAIDYVTQTTIPHGYLLTGFAGEEPSEDLVNYLATVTERLDKLNITEVTEIPADANCVVLHAPTADLSETETAVLRAYINRGGSILLNTSPSSVQNCPNILSLTAEFGLSALPGHVTDHTSGYYVSGVSVDTLTPKVNSTHDLYMVYENQYVPRMPWSHAIAAADTLPTGVTATPIFATSSAAVRIVDGETTGTAGQLYVAMEAEKEIVNDDGTATTAELIWFGSTEAFNEENAEATEGGNYFYYTFGFATISKDYTSPYAAIESIRITTESLDPIDGVVKAVIMAVIVALIPGALLTTGIVIWVKRRKRR